MSTVLVVEDDVAVAHALAELLTEEGYTVVRAGNGQEALELLATMQRPDVILLDWLMPVMNGAQFLKALTQNIHWAEIPVIVTSAQAPFVPPMRAMLRKPYAVETLVSTMNDVLAAGRLRRAG
jgi:CheY-like chemotaxis protein